MGGSRQQLPNLIATSLETGGCPLDADRLEAQMSALTSFVGGILFEVDRHGRYLSVLTAEPQLLATSVERMAGLGVADVLGEEVAGPFLTMFARVLDTGQPESHDYVLDVPAGRRSFRCEARPTKLADGSPSRSSLTLLIRDITEEMTLKAKLVEAERLAAMGLVAASIGHEIRQPLAFATTSLDVLEREIDRAGASTDRAREALGHVRDAVRRMAGIAASVGVVAHDRKIEREMSTDVRRPIDAAIDLCSSELQGRAHVEVDVPDLPRVHVSEGELCQVIANLLLNAAHALDPDATQNRIVVSATLQDERMRISVSDNGCGIDPVNVERVFDPFFSTKAPGRGTGLGLFVSRRIIEESGGTLEIQSMVDGGTTVTISLPLAKSTSHPADSAMRPRARAGSTPPSKHVARPSDGRLQVLIIDDERAFLRSVELVLDGIHDVVVESQSKAALELLRQNPRRFDAVLCDLSMPLIDGVAFYGHMDKLGIADRFVLMTAGAFTAHGEEFLRASKCRRIAKPFTLEELLAVLASVAPQTTAAQAASSQ